MKKIIKGVTYNTETAEMLLHTTKQPVVNGITVPDIRIGYTLYRRKPKDTVYSKEDDYFLHQKVFDDTMGTCNETIKQVSYPEVLKLYKIVAESVGTDAIDHHTYRHIVSECIFHML